MPSPASVTTLSFYEVTCSYHMKWLDAIVFLSFRSGIMGVCSYVWHCALLCVPISGVVEVQEYVGHSAYGTTTTQLHNVNTMVV